MIKRVLAACACLLAAGCVNVGGADAIKPIASDVSVSSFVQEVVVAKAPDSLSAEAKAKFIAVVGATLKTCARGSRPLRLEVNITDFHQQNAAQTILVGDSNRIRGAARFVDPTSGEVVADYDVNRSSGGGGLIAAAAMSDAPTQMSEAFGQELCRRVFIAR